MPYYKWSQRLLSTLPGLGPEIAPMLNDLAAENIGNKSGLIEQICLRIIDELRRQGLSTSRDSFLLSHAAEIQNCISYAGLRQLHLMAE